MKPIQKTICIFLLLATLQVQAQQGNSCPEDLFPFYDKEKKAWGYADVMGMMLIEPIFTKVSPYSSNKAIVQKGNLCGVLDCNGNLIVPVQYDKILNFRYNKAWASKDGMWGLIDDKGRNVLAFQFTDMYAIHGTELTWVKKDDLWGLFDEDHTKYIIMPQYTVAQVLSQNCSLIQKNGKLGVVNHVNGGFLLEPNIENVKKISPRDIIFNQDGKWGIFNNIGKVTLNPTYDSLDVFRTNTLIAKLNNQYGLMDLAGGVLLPVEYQSIALYQGGFYRIKKNNLYGYASVKGKVFIKPKYVEATDFANGSAVVKEKNLYGIIDLKDSFVVKPVYTTIFSSDFNEYYVGKKDDAADEKSISQQDLILHLTTSVFAVQAFQQVSLADSLSAIRIKKNDKWYYYNGKTQSMKFDIGFDLAEPFSNGVAIVKQGTHTGIINNSGTYILEPGYTSVEVVKQGIKRYYIVTESGGKGLFDAAGKRILASSYQEIILSAPNHIKVKKDNLWSLLRLDGTVLSTEFYTFMDASDVMPVPVMRSKKWCLLNQDGIETKLIKAVSIKQDTANTKAYIVNTGKTTYSINRLGEKL